MDKKYDEIIEKLGKEKVKKDVSLAGYTSFKIGGPADLFYEADNEEELVRVFRVVREIGISYFILGGGSNILAGDKGFRGIVIKVQSSKFKIQSDGSPQEFLRNSTGRAKFKVSVDAGVNMSNLVNECSRDSLTGLEFMAGIPGTVGGAVRGNAGAWQQSIGEKTLRVKVLTEDVKVKWIEQKDCGFIYRKSRFKESGEVVLAVEFELEKSNKGKLEEKIKEYLSRRSAQPKDPSAGSIFINPKPKSAGELIENCGLKGQQIGGAKISEIHANFIVNTGGAKAVDVVALINFAKEKVTEKFNVDLKEEIVRIGEF